MKEYFPHLKEQNLMILWELLAKWLIKIIENMQKKKNFLSCYKTELGPLLVGTGANKNSKYIT